METTSNQTEVRVRERNKRRIIIPIISFMLFISLIVSLNDDFQENVIDIHPGIFVSGIFLLNIFSLLATKSNPK